ncbi:Hypothetical predicted protein [Lecanosticta acicola]|uniref:Uncharacterized protein n=1 Tax=Lecanosticta acicola TaxID=111012 RepID=A0AAI8YVW1_9PEZI|nr:Hypothetical predicted protein [Lecanosticta acicola]
MPRRPSLHRQAAKQCALFVADHILPDAPSEEEVNQHLREFLDDNKLYCKSNKKLVPISVRYFKVSIFASILTLCRRKSEGLDEAMRAKYGYDKTTFNLKNLLIACRSPHMKQDAPEQNIPSSALTTEDDYATDRSQSSFSERSLNEPEKGASSQLALSSRSTLVPGKREAAELHPGASVAKRARLQPPKRAPAARLQNRDTAVESMPDAPVLDQASQRRPRSSSSVLSAPPPDYINGPQSGEGAVLILSASDSATEEQTPDAEMMSRGGVEAGLSDISGLVKSATDSLFHSINLSPKQDGPVPSVDDLGQQLQALFIRCFGPACIVTWRELRDASRFSASQVVKALVGAYIFQEIFDERVSWCDWNCRGQALPNQTGMLLLWSNRAHIAIANIYKAVNERAFSLLAAMVHPDPSWPSSRDVYALLAERLDFPTPNKQSSPVKQIAEKLSTDLIATLAPYIDHLVQLARVLDEQAVGVDEWQPAFHTDVNAAITKALRLRVNLWKAKQHHVFSWPPSGAALELSSMMPLLQTSDGSRQQIAFTSFPGIEVAFAEDARPCQVVRAAVMTVPTCGGFAKQDKCADTRPKIRLRLGGKGMPSESGLKVAI